MRKEDVMIEEELSGREDESKLVDAMARKASMMLAAYAVTVGLLVWAAILSDSGTIWWRGALCVSAVWCGHLDTASWIFEPGSPSWWGRGVLAIRNFSRRRPFLCALGLVAGAGGALLYCVDWNEFSPLGLGAEIAAWLLMMGMAGRVAALLNVGKLANVQRAQGGKVGRLILAARYAWLDAVAALAMWSAICRLAGWV